MNRTSLGIGLGLAMFSAAAGMGCGGQCIKEVYLKPTVSVYAGTVVGSGDIAFKFDKCLTPEEQAAANRVKTALASAYEKVATGALKPADYNSLVEMAQETLRKAIYVVNSSEQPGFNAGDRGQAFKEVDDVAKRIANATNL